MYLTMCVKFQNLKNTDSKICIFIHLLDKRYTVYVSELESVERKQRPGEGVRSSFRERCGMLCMLTWEEAQIL